MTRRDPIPDVETIRASFPALQRREGGVPVAYFDGPGGTQVPQPVVDAVTDYLLHHNGNAHWPFATSRETMAITAGARGAMADLLGCESDEVVFGPNMTTLTFHLSRALARWCAPGDEVVVTELDHHANIDPWRALAVDFGLRVRAVRFDVPTGRLDHQDLARALSPRTRIVAVGGASNALGTVNDLERVVAAARSVGAWTFVDAVHLVPHEGVDVRALGCDFLVCSAYKFYGPHIGVLYGRRDLLGELDVPKLEPAPDEAPEKLETGTPVFEGIAGVGAVVDWLASLAGPRGDRRIRLGRTYAAFHERGERLISRLWEGLAAVEGVRLYGPEPGSGPRTPTLAFTVGERPSAKVAARLATEGLYLSHGDFYARTAVRRLGKAEQGLLRAGCVAYTTEGEIDRLIAAVGRIAAGR
jgi:cysteine desulfurase family protein (TIGR01976 family)